MSRYEQKMVSKTSNVAIILAQSNVTNTGSFVLLQTSSTDARAATCIGIDRRNALMGVDLRFLDALCRSVTSRSSTNFIYK